LEDPPPSEFRVSCGLRSRTTDPAALTAAHIVSEWRRAVIGYVTVTLCATRYSGASYLLGGGRADVRCDRGDDCTSNHRVFGGTYPSTVAKDARWRV
jgi:hypothetical protein